MDYDADTKLATFNLGPGGAGPFHSNFNPTVGFDASAGAWVNWQLRVTRSSSEGVADGTATLYLNSATAHTTQTGIVIPAANHDLVDYGYFQNNGMRTDGVIEHEYSEFEIDTAFDANWHLLGLTPTFYLRPPA